MKFIVTEKGKNYRPTVDENINSWGKIARLFIRDTNVCFDSLVQAVYGHDRAGGAEAYVKWIERENYITRSR